MRGMLIVLLLTSMALGLRSASAAPSSENAAPPHRGEAPTPWQATGKVTETMNAGRYTYVKVDTGEENVWAAGPITQVEVGDTVSLSGGFEMVDFQSTILGRSFESIYLVAFMQVTPRAGASRASPVGHEAGPPGNGATLDLSGIPRAEGGHTVGEILGSDDELAGKQVTVRGKVVKFSSRILGRNWIHLRDGTAGPGGAMDLVVTTDAVAEVGNTLLVRGTVVTNTDLGSGYVYDVLIEKASITLE